MVLQARNIDTSPLTDCADQELEASAKHNIRNHHKAPLHLFHQDE